MEVQHGSMKSMIESTEHLSEVNETRLATLLLVDDESNILSSLRRVFRPQGYRILTAGSGAEGLAALEREPVDLVISDMRMPVMDGAQFLEQVASRWPDTVRILLTGYADISSTVAAINKGRIYQYVAKPWEDNGIRLTVKHALSQQFNEQERRRLEALTQRQNAELKELNAGLEYKVAERTAEIRLTLEKLDQAHGELKESYATAVKVFANLVEFSEGASPGHSRRVAEHARAIAEQLSLDDAAIQDVYFAALLHDIGKIGMPENLLGRPFSSLSSREKRQLAEHSIRGEAALLALHPLKEAAGFIRSHHELFNGNGFPDGLSGEDIPLGARILMVANEYDALLKRTLFDRKYTPETARNFIGDQRGVRYDPAVVEAFLQVLDRGALDQRTADEQVLSGAELQEGMILSRDLMNHNGMLLLSKGHRLTNGLIEKIQSLEYMERQKYEVGIYASSISG